MSTSQWQYERLDNSEVSPLIQARVRELVSASGSSVSSSAAPTPLVRARAGHTPRLHPLVAFTLINATEGSGLSCAWRVRGTSASPSFDLTLWYAPSSSERSLEHDVLALKLM